MPILEDFIINLAAGLAQQLFQVLYHHLAKPQQRALQQVYQNGFTTMLRTAGQGLSEAELGRIAEVFGDFLTQPRVADKFLDLALSEQMPDSDQLTRQFQQFGGPAALTNINFDFERSMLSFQAALTSALLAEASKDDSPLHHQVNIHMLANIQRLLYQITDAQMSTSKTASVSITSPGVAPSFSPVTGSYHSCFISYSSHDEDFVYQLYNDLRAQGVPCWFAPENIPLGAKIRQSIENAISGNHRLLVVLSTHSINSNWVEDEVETAFEKERKTKQVLLLPVRLDDAVMSTDTAWAATIRRTRNIGNFTEWRQDSRYQQTFARLLQALRIENTTTMVH